MATRSPSSTPIIPAASAGPPVIRLAGAPADAVVNAVLSVMPLDDFVPEAAWCMAVVDDPEAEPPIFDEFPRGAGAAREREFTLNKIERFAFYARVDEVLRRRGDRASGGSTAT